VTSVVSNVAECVRYVLADNED